MHATHRPALKLQCVQVVNLTVVAIESELPDKRLDAWLGAELAIFFSGAANISLAFDDLLAARADDDVHAAVSKVDFCPLAHGNMLNITVRWAGAAWAAALRPCRHAAAPTCWLAAAGRAGWQRVQCQWPGMQQARALPAAAAPAPAQVRLEGETAFGGMPVRDDLMSGTTVDVLVGHHDEMQERGHEARLTALLGNSAT